MNAAIYRDIPIGYAPTVAGIGAKLKKIRKPLMTQEELAERMGVEQPAVSSWETERSVPDAVQLAKIAAALKHPAGMFLEDVPEYHDFLEASKRPGERTAGDSVRQGGHTEEVVTHPDTTSGITHPHSIAQSGVPRVESTVAVRRPSRSPVVVAIELKEHADQLKLHAELRQG